nr:hypothetical protein Iba_chr02dCG13740 [Ipomoea batatas]
MVNIKAYPGSTANDWRIMKIFGNQVSQQIRAKTNQKQNYLSGPNGSHKISHLNLANLHHKCRELTSAYDATKTLPTIGQGSRKTKAIASGTLNDAAYP